MNHKAKKKKKKLQCLKSARGSDLEQTRNFWKSTRNREHAPKENILIKGQEWVVYRRGNQKPIGTQVLKVISVREMQMSTWDITCKLTNLASWKIARVGWDVRTVGGCGVGAELLDGHLACLIKLSINISCEQKFHFQRNSHRGSWGDQGKDTHCGITYGVRKQTGVHPWASG